jgi:subtilisin family serine protease
MMRTKRLFTTASILTACALLFCLCGAGISPQRVGAESTNKAPKVKRSKHEKISPSLSRQYRDDELVQVILQLNSAPTGRLKALLRRAGIKVKDNFEAFNSAVVELPSSVIAELSEFDEVEFISLDREVHLLGHVEETTGAVVMRTQSGNSGLKGKDVNIAVLDSGIDKDHHQIGSRIEAQFDFTGEGRLDDPYGHGTHVASLAAGVDHVAHGAYTGIAPEAKVINLRVLNSGGLGAVSNVMKALNWICCSGRRLSAVIDLYKDYGNSSSQAPNRKPTCYRGTGDRTRYHVSFTWK